MRARTALAATVSTLLALVAGFSLGLAVSAARARVAGDVIVIPAGEACYADGTCLQIGWVPSATSTPPPTNTPRATDTPVPTADLPPTQEHIPRTGTPVPPPPATCAVKIGPDNIRLRAAPTTGAAILDVLQRATVQTVVEWRQGELYLWARNERGWFAARQMTWWVYGIEGQSETCVDVPGWPGGLAPPAPVVALDTAWGVWNGPGSSTDEVLAFIGTLKAAGVQPAVTVYGVGTLGNRAYDAGALVLARPWLADCPDMSKPPAASAQERVNQALATLAGARYDWLVLTNECVWPSTAYAAQWIRAAIEAVANRGVARLVPVVWPPGHPEFSDVAALAAAFDTTRIELGWGMNLYPVEPGRDLSARGGISEYTVWRWRLYRHQLPDGVRLIVTEAARGDGSERADMADIARFVARVGDDLDAVMFWYNAMPEGLGHWRAAVLWGRLVELAAAIIAAF